MRLDHTTAIVTGAASGLGAATAHTLAAAGVHVVGLDLAPSVEQAEPTDGVELLAVDVTDPEQVQSAVDHAAGRAPETGPLRTVVNCAGIAPASRMLGRRGPHDVGLYTRVVQVNLVGTFTVMTLAAARIAEAEPLEHGQRGMVVNTASVAAFEGQVGQVAYSASKAGVAGMTLPAARDLAQHGIRVNTISPGILETPMLATVTDEFRAGLSAHVPFPARLGRPEEYAHLVLALAENDYVNGETVRLDGALRMGPR